MYYMYIVCRDAIILQFSLLSLTNETEKETTADCSCQLQFKTLFVNAGLITHGISQIQITIEKSLDKHGKKTHICLFFSIFLYSTYAFINPGSAVPGQVRDYFP